MSKILHNQLPGFCLLLLSVSAQVSAGYYGDGAFVDADLGLRYESNLSRANDGRDIEEDMVAALSAGAGYLKTLNGNSQLLISAYLAHERFAEFKDLNNIAVNTAIVYTIQPKPGYTAPWYELGVNVTTLKFNKSNIRDGHILRGKLSAGKRLSDRITSTVAYAYSKRYSDAKVFDTQNHEIDFSLLYSLTSRSKLFANYSAHIGETVSTSTPNAGILAIATSVAPDDVFSPGLGPGCNLRRCAYRLDTLSHFFEAGMEVNINQLLSLDFSSRYFIVDADNWPAYKGWVYRAGLFMRF